MPENRSDAVRRRLMRRYLVGLAAVATALVAAYALADHALVERRADSREINLSGRQRMLSQRIAKSALLATGTGDERAREALRTDTREWVETHHALLSGDPERGLRGISDPATAAQLASLTAEVEHVQRAAARLERSMVTGDTARARRELASLIARGDAFLGGMDAVTFALDAAYVDEMSRLRRYGLALIGLLMAMLAAVAHVVFRPSVEMVGRALAEAAQQGLLLQTVIDTIPDHIYVKDLRGRATLRNLASARALGADTPEATLGETDADASERVGAVDLGETALGDDLQVIQTGAPLLNKEEPSASGGWLLTTKVPLRDVEGAIIGLVGVSRDVTEARASEAQFQSLVEHSVAGTAIIQNGTFVYTNPRMADIFGYEADEMVGLAAPLIFHPDDRPLVQENLRRRVAGEANALAYSARGQRKDGSTIYVELSGVAGEHAGRPAIIGTVMDVTQREEMEQTLFHQAHHDELTGLPNRALFASRLEVALAESGGDGDFAVLFLDLNRFKAVNDTLGHSAGDELLREVGRRLLATVRPSDTVARLGGDEFAVLLQGLPSPGHAQEIAERIDQALRISVDLGGRPLSVEASIGIVEGIARDASPDAVLREADLAMYEAKRTGGGHQTYSAARHRPQAERLRLEVDLQHAVPRGELRLVYQPIVNLGDGALSGFEALVRWQHPELGLLTPDAFIEAADAGGLITVVDTWVLREAALQLAAWTRVGPRGLRLNVNCSGRDLQDPAYTGAVAELAQAGPDAPERRLSLEITEDRLVQDLDAVSVVMRRLQGVGADFCIDDFGTGYSSLSMLHALPIDTLKVDRTFVDRMDGLSSGRQLVDTILGLAARLEMTTVGEGIETEAQLGALRAMGCTYGQGYLLSRPVGPDEALALVQSDAPPWLPFWQSAGALAA